MRKVTVFSTRSHGGGGFPPVCLSLSVSVCDSLCVCSLARACVWGGGGVQVQEARFRLDDALRVQAAAVPEDLKKHLVIIGAHPRLQYYVLAMRRQRPDVAIVVVTNDKVGPFGRGAMVDYLGGKHPISL